MQADAFGAMSVCIPAIGCGVRGFPPREAAELAVRTITGTLSRCRSVGRVLFVCPEPQAFSAFSDAALAMPDEILTAEEWQEEWQEVPIRRRCYWIRIYGFLRQHWAIVAETRGRKAVAFFDDYGAVFDEIPLKGTQHENLILDNLGFEPWGPGTETARFVAPQRYRPHRGKPNRIYSTALTQGKAPPQDWY
jgi:hypothetical protein